MSANPSPTSLRPPVATGPGQVTSPRHDFVKVNNGAAASPALTAAATTRRIVKHHGGGGNGGDPDAVLLNDQGKIDGSNK